MQTNRLAVLGVVVVAGLATAVYKVGAQQGVPAQPGTPSAAPRPANPTPRPANPTPSPSATPAQGQPSGVQPTLQPNRPTTTNPDGTPRLTGQTPQPGQTPRYERPFAFASPNVEARFVESSRRLAAIETRMAQSNQTLLKRLGDARGLAPEKQSAAMAEIIQQMLMDQAAMQRYLVQARTAWTGELEPLPAEIPEDQIPTTTPVDAPTGTPSATVPTNPPR